MGTVTVMCPQTGKQVSTGLELDRLAFTALPLTRHFVFHCWICGREHEWTRRWATFCDQRDLALADAPPAPNQTSPRHLRPNDVH